MESYNKFTLIRLGTTGEYSVLGLYIGPPFSQDNIASLEPDILPPTHVYRAVE